MLTKESCVVKKNLTSDNWSWPQCFCWIQQLNSSQDLRHTQWFSTSSPHFSSAFHFLPCSSTACDDLKIYMYILSCLSIYLSILCTAIDRCIHPSIHPSFTCLDICLYWMVKNKIQLSISDLIGFIQLFMHQTASHQQTERSPRSWIEWRTLWVNGGGEKEVMLDNTGWLLRSLSCDGQKGSARQVTSLTSAGQAIPDEPASDSVSGRVEIVKSQFDDVGLGKLLWEMLLSFTDFKFSYIPLVVGIGSKMLYMLNLGEAPRMGWGREVWAQESPQGAERQSHQLPSDFWAGGAARRPVSFSGCQESHWLVFYADFLGRPQTLCTVPASLITAALNCWELSIHLTSLTGCLEWDRVGTWGSGRKRNPAHCTSVLFSGFVQRGATHVKPCGLFKPLLKRQLSGGVTLLLFWEDWTRYCAFPCIWTYDAIGVIRWLCSLGHFADFEDGVSRLGCGCC